jgi:hypothetical protein
MKPSKRARRRARGRAIASRPPYSAAALAWGHWRTVGIARAGGFQAYQRKWAFLFADESDCFDCGLSQEEARDELQRIERSLIDEDAVADALEFMDEYGEVFKGLASGPET